MSSSSQARAEVAAESAMQGHRPAMTILPPGDPAEMLLHAQELHMSAPESHSAKAAVVEV